MNTLALANPTALSSATAPAVERTSMRATPWFGLRRGLLLALWPGLRADFGVADAASRPWAAAARRRRRVLLLAVLALGITAALLGRAAGIQPGVPLALLTLLFAWVGSGFVTALMGTWVLLRGGDPIALAPSMGDDDRAASAPLSRGARTALVMPICNEDLATVFGGLRATCESLAATGALPLFDVYVLSDTTDPALRAAELRAWRELRASLGDADDLPGGRIFYRCRRHRSERKAGNVADFCRRWGQRYRYMVVLDADSTMHGDTLVALVRTMEAHPRVGIAQTLPQPIGHATLHARAQQFGARVTGRLFALGMAYWQLGESHYWGHNAILRIAPFMAHCRMAHLPGRGGLSGPILSHDFVEAAMMRRAGFEVWLLPSLGGSWEQTPPNLLDELQRDRRWCQGNLQNARLLAEPGWRPAHRAMLATGALSYLVAPMWLALVASGAFLASGGAPSEAPAAWALWAATLSLLLLPRALGVAAVLLQRRAALHGGGARLLASALLEALLSALQAPVRMLAHTGFVLGALTGLRLEWRSPPRDARRVAWTDAAARLGLLCLPALALAAVWLPGARGLAWPLLPVLLPLALAVPMAVLSGDAGFGAWLRRCGLLLVDDEVNPPRTLQRARSAVAFAALHPAPAAAPAITRPARPSAAAEGFAAARAGWRRLRTTGLQTRRAAAAPRAAWRQGRWAGAVSAMLLVAILPRPATGPELDDPAPPAHARTAFEATGDAASDLSVVQVGLTSIPRRAPRRAVDGPPARYIDDAVRERALRAVAVATLMEG
ncbi:MAG: glucans biosynthesis glucosyltransferase MdoH [Rubrivivax sp.]